MVATMANGVARRAMEEAVRVRSGWTDVAAAQKGFVGIAALNWLINIVVVLAAVFAIGWLISLHWFRAIILKVAKPYLS